MAHLLNFPGDIKSNAIDASSAMVIRTTEKDIKLPEIKMHLSDELLVQLYQMDNQVKYSDGYTEQLGGKLVKTSDDHKVKIHDPLTMELLKTVETGHERSIRRVLVWDGVPPNGPQIITCAGDGRVRVFDFNGRLLRKLEKPEDPNAKGYDKTGHEGKVNVIACSEEEPYEDTTVLSGGVDLTVRIWSLKTGKQVAVCRGHQEEIMGVCFCVGRGEQKLVGSMDFVGEVRLWDRGTGELMRIISAPDAKEEQYF